MKKRFLFIALLAGTVSFSQAQQRPQRSPEEMAQRNVEMLEKQLNLTADQKAKIYTIALGQAKSIDSLRNSGADRQTMWPKMRELQEANDKKIAAFLTDDQKKLYDKWIEERRNRMRGGQGAGRPQN